MPVRVGLKFIELWKSSMEDAVVKYEEEPIIKGQIVFYGPSNFTRWSKKWIGVDLRDDLLGTSGAKCCINRGFGSSGTEHHLYYYNRMVKPLEPKVLVYSCSGNNSSFGYTDEEAFELAQRVIIWAKTDFPDIRIYLNGPNPRNNMSPEALATYLKDGERRRKFAEETENCFYMDALAWKELQNPDYFEKDNVHFNAAGYKEYKRFMQYHLKNELDQF